MIQLCIKKNKWQTDRQPKVPLKPRNLLPWHHEQLPASPKGTGLADLNLLIGNRRIIASG